MTEQKKEKPKVKAVSREKPTSVSSYEYIMSKTIENVLSTMQMYTTELHEAVMSRAMDALKCKAALRLNLLQITDEEEKKALQLLAGDPSRATQAALNYGFNFQNHTTSDLGWNLGLSVLLLGLLR